MKFYRDYYYHGFYFSKIESNKLTAVYYCTDMNIINIIFFKNAKEHNNKNASFINHFKYKEFRLNNEFYGNYNDFTKHSWRRFTKLQAFL
jgi:hypothetical protein